MAIHAEQELRRIASRSASCDPLTLRLVEWLEGQDPPGCAKLDKTRVQVNPNDFTEVNSSHICADGPLFADLMPVQRPQQRTA